MKGIKQVVVVLLLLFFIVGVLGCGVDYKQFVSGNKITEEQLIKVQIQFTNGKQTECFVKSLGLEKNAQVYNGGSSLNYMYNKDGHIVGSFNYQNVTLMNILPDEAID